MLLLLFKVLNILNIVLGLIIDLATLKICFNIEVIKLDGFVAVFYRTLIFLKVAFYFVTDRG